MNERMITGKAKADMIIRTSISFSVTFKIKAAFNYHYIHMQVMHDTV